MSPTQIIYAYCNDLQRRVCYFYIDTSPMSDKALCIRLLVVVITTLSFGQFMIEYLDLQPVHERPEYVLRPELWSDPRMMMFL